MNISADAGLDLPGLRLLAEHLARRLCDLAVHGDAAAMEICTDPCTAPAGLHRLEAARLAQQQAQGVGEDSPEFHIIPS